MSTFSIEHLSSSFLQNYFHSGSCALRKVTGLCDVHHRIVTIWNWGLVVWNQLACVYMIPIPNNKSFFPSYLYDSLGPCNVHKMSLSFDFLPSLSDNILIKYLITIPPINYDKRTKSEDDHDDTVDIKFDKI